MDKIFTSKISKNQAKDTGLAVVLILLFLGTYFEDFIYFKFSLLALVITMIFPLAFKYFAIVWLGFSKLLGLISSKIILSVIFFCIVFPVAVFRKLLGKDVMKLKHFKRDASSVMKTRNLIFSKEHLDKPY
jgi:hypothetical protein